MRGKRPLEQDEVRKMMECFEGPLAARNRAMFALGINTGFRIGTLLQIKLRHILRNGRVMKTISLPPAMFKRKREGQTKKLTTNTRALVQEWVDGMDVLPIFRWYRDFRDVRELYLFQSQSMQNNAIGYNQARMIIQTAAKRARVYDTAVSTHSMRKTVAARVLAHFTEKYQKGETSTPPVYMVQLYLGHVDPSATLAYLSFVADDVPEEVLDVI